MIIRDRKMKENSGEVLALCTDLGRIMLENGAEVFRVEETLLRISHYFGVEDVDFFVLTNGILSSATDKNGNNSARVKFIPNNKACLMKVVAVNQLSRDVERGKYTFDQVKDEVVRISNLNTEPSFFLVGATALGSGAFTFLYNGTLTDGFVALIAGFILGLFTQYISKKHLTKITQNLLGSALVTAVCLLFHHHGLSTNMNAMIAGAIIPLIPGVTFINGIRDIARGDFLSGVVRLLDATLVFLCIAIGVGVVLSFYSRFNGGLVI